MPIQTFLSTVELVNLTSGEATLGPQLPVVGLHGCAVAHEGHVYWVRAWGGGDDWTGDVYRARGELLLAVSNDGPVC